MFTGSLFQLKENLGTLLPSVFQSSTEALKYTQ